MDSSAGKVRYGVIPVRVGSGPVGAQLVMLEFRDVIAKPLEDAARALAIIGAATLAMAAGACWLVTGRVLAPIRQVRSTAEQIGESDLRRRIDVVGNDDVAQLARTFNTMLDRLETAFVTQREFVDNAGHELRTPITVIRGHLELMGDDPREREETRVLVLDELARMNRMVDDPLVLAKSEQPAGQSADRAADGSSGSDRPEARSAARVVLWVADSGAGVAEEDRERIFERFARGNDQRRTAGAGLGLAIVRSIARAHGGDVRLVPQQGPGARFELDLPVQVFSAETPADPTDEEVHG